MNEMILVATGRRILWEESPMKVSPLETTNKFNVLTIEETQDECFLKPKTNCIQVIIMFPNSFQNYDALHFDHKI